jgi:hypothetical protein
VPVRTFADWGDPPPGYCEADLVEHCGGVKHEGNFVHSLTVTDIHSAAGENPGPSDLNTPATTACC